MGARSFFFQPVKQVVPGDVVDDFLDGGRAQLPLGLPLKLRLWETDPNGRHQAFIDVFLDAAICVCPRQLGQLGSLSD